MGAHLVEQPLLAERLAGLVPRVHQAIGPEHQQIVADAPGHLPPLDAARGRESERRRGGLEPLGIAEPGHAERVGVARAGVGEPAGQRVEHAVEHAEVHLGLAPARCERLSSSALSVSSGVTEAAAWMPAADMTSAITSAAENPCDATSPSMTPTRPRPRRVKV